MHHGNNLYITQLAQRYVAIHTAGISYSRHIACFCAGSDHEPPPVGQRFQISPQGCAGRRSAAVVFVRRAPHGSGNAPWRSIEGCIGIVPDSHAPDRCRQHSRHLLSPRPGVCRHQARGRIGNLACRRSRGRPRRQVGRRCCRSPVPCGQYR